MINYYPFFELRSPLLADMLGVKDKRSIISRLNEIGVEIRVKGKSKYVITQDIIEALKEKPETKYIPKSKLSKELLK